MADHADIAADMLDHQMAVKLAQHEAGKVQTVLAGRGVIRCVFCQSAFELVQRTTRRRA